MAFALVAWAGCGAGARGKPLTADQGTGGTGATGQDAAAPDTTPTEAAGTGGQPAGGPAETGGLATYALDLTPLYPTTFQAQDLAAFSIDLTTHDKKITRLDWDTVVQWPSGAHCTGLPQDVDYVSDSARGDSAIGLTAPDDKLKGFRSPYRVRLRQVEFDVTHAGTLDDWRGPINVCLAVRAMNGEWTWRTRTFNVNREVRDGRFAATVDLDVADIDAVAILFDAPQVVDRIRYTIESAGRGPGGDVGVPIQSAACCDACKEPTSGLASGYCCTASAPAPEPCTEQDLPVSPTCVPYGDLYDAAAAACRATGTWLREVSTRDETNECPPASRDILESGLSRRAHFKCCRDPYFVPQPPNRPTPTPDCVLVGGSFSPCASHQDMLERAVRSCFDSGLIHRSITFLDHCAPGSAGTSMTMSVCCRPGVAGPPADSCSR